MDSLSRQLEVAESIKVGPSGPTKEEVSAESLDIKAKLRLARQEEKKLKKQLDLEKLRVVRNMAMH